MARGLPVAELKRACSRAQAYAKGAPERTAPQSQSRIRIASLLASEPGPVRIQDDLCSSRRAERYAVISPAVTLLCRYAQKAIIGGAVVTQRIKKKTLCNVISRFGRSVRIADRAVLITQRIDKTTRLSVTSSGF